jgi:hypothetical protein
MSLHNFLQLFEKINPEAKGDLSSGVGNIELLLKIKQSCS